MVESRRQVSANGGVQARWRADGKELLFLSLDGKVMGAAVVPGPTPQFRAPTVLFESLLKSPSGLSAGRRSRRFLHARERVMEQIERAPPWLGRFCSSAFNLYKGEGRSFHWPDELRFELELLSGHLKSGH
ncbi:hypothetical protein [Gemmatimonas sp.]|uniref:hypothetical protein n=1 Tax=Gemmatimonas sp. TaxID=1962908 RepID=UPI00286DCD02|nr:hypothetical protein [Gemmatimonas sp.]